MRDTKISSVHDKSEAQFVDVLLPFGDMKANHPLTYKVPPQLEGKIQTGDPVLVPFRNATASGYVISKSNDPKIQTKFILEINSKLAALPPEILNFSRWLANRYVSSWWEALRSFIVILNGKSIATNPHDLQTNEISLTGEQEKAACAVRKALDENLHQTFLLHGITGSGKTEIYLACARRALELGKDILVLVPEIPLSFQVARRFREMFGNFVAILHSSLSDKEKRDEQYKLYTGEAKIAIGPRMALFAPFKNLGLIMMDEEHDPSYKQEQHPRYHSLIVAQKLAEDRKAVLLLGSATPSFESYHAATEKRFTLLSLQSRYESRPLPEVILVDLKEKKTFWPFSIELLELLKDTISSGKQAILFLNRRGFSPLVLCKDCGYAFHCPRCNISLTFHAKFAHLRCHYCDYRMNAPHLCPRCESYSLTYKGFGTQRLEEEIRNRFPLVKALRMDRDTTSRRGATKEIVEAFLKKEAQILIGTQMVTKGFDFPDVNLVGILNADQLLHFPDFRAGERTFQLLTQVAGRAGRGSSPGKVILQTYNPEHPVIQAAARHDYVSFYQKELETRKLASYPPFVSLANILLSGKEETKLEEEIQALRALLEKFSAGGSFSILGPAPCPIPKINENFRWHLILKGKSADLLAATGKEICAWHASRSSKKIRLTVDIDPVQLL